MKRVYPVEERCINCHLCEVACIVSHSTTKTALGAFQVEKLSFNSVRPGAVDPAVALEEGNPYPLNRCRVDVQGSVFLSTSCRHCREPDCVRACKNGSLYVDEAGRVLLREDHCVGCWMCLMACRYGAIERNPYVKNVQGKENNGINQHCDLCRERSCPACVSICPTQALVYEEREAP